MKIKHILPVTLFATASLLSCNGQKGKSSVNLKTQIDSVSYAIGMAIGENLKKDNLDSVNLDIVKSAMHSVFAKDSMLIDSRQSQALIQSYVGGIQKRQGEVCLAQGKKFLEENAKKAGVKTTPDGLQYMVIKDGTGESPCDTCTVKVNYSGTLIDGKVFDSSEKHGGPATFPLDHVIPGWTEGLKMMKVGAKWRLFVPSELAYGEHPRDPSLIPPNSTLIFDIELLEVVHK